MTLLRWHGQPVLCQGRVEGQKKETASLTVRDAYFYLELSGRTQAMNTSWIR